MNWRTRILGKPIVFNGKTIEELLHNHERETRLPGIYYGRPLAWWFGRRTELPPKEFLLAEDMEPLYNGVVTTLKYIDWFYW